MMVPDIGKYTKKLFVDPVEQMHKHASDMLSDVGMLWKLAERLTPAHYEAYDVLGPPAHTHTAVLIALNMEETFLEAVRNSTGELVRDMDRVVFDVWQKAAAILEVAPTETPLTLLDKIKLKYLNVKTLFENDVDTFRRWSELDRVRPYLVAEENALTAKRAHLRLVGSTIANNATMNHFVRASGRMIDAYWKYFDDAKPWIEGKHGDESEATRAMIGDASHLYTWFAGARARDFIQLSERNVVLVNPIQRLVLK